MKKNIYAIYDEAVKAYSTHFNEENDVSAQRFLVPILNNPTNQMASQPKDFSLWRVGSFDHDTGILEGTEAGKPIFICEVMSLANQEDK